MTRQFVPFMSRIVCKESSCSCFAKPANPDYLQRICKQQVWNGPIFWDVMLHSPALSLGGTEKYSPLQHL